MNIDSFLKSLEETMTADVVPALVAPMQMLRTKKGLSKPVAKNKEKTKPRKNIVDSLTDNIDLSTDIIPDDAESDSTPLKDVNTSSGPAELPDKKTGDKLIDPTVALVAPDVTPKAEEPIDPSSLPIPGTVNPTSALNTILGTNPAPASNQVNAGVDTKKEASSQEALFRSFGISMPQVSESVPEAIKDMQVTQALAETVAAATQPDIPMPVHQEGDIRKLCSAFRSFMG